jgi:hypothetical protein
VKTSAFSIVSIRHMRMAATTVLITTIACLALLELAARLLLEPSGHSAGRLGGVELPPLQIARTPEFPLTDRAESVITTNSGDVVTRGDLWGLWQVVPTLGYQQQTDARSVNGWWQSNNIGARANHSVTPDVPAGKQRVIIFGDSYAHGSRVAQDAVWTTHIARWAPRLEPVNLAADGYSMAQAYLRYRKVAATLDYQTTLLAIVPTADLWRDINVIRDLAEYWNWPMPMPRAVLTDDGLTIVPAPYASPDDFLAANYPEPSSELIDHLRRYDRFYFRARYEAPPVLGGSVLYKVAAAAFAAHQERQVRRQLEQPDSEAVVVTRSIMAAMQAEAAADGADFVALILPMQWEVGPLRDDPLLAASWHAIAQALCSGITRCIDLAPVLTALPASCIDAGADGTHYGPRLNVALALTVMEILADPGIDSPPAAVGCDAAARQVD